MLSGHELALVFVSFLFLVGAFIEKSWLGKLLNVGEDHIIEKYAEECHRMYVIY